MINKENLETLKELMSLIGGSSSQSPSPQNDMYADLIGKPCIIRSYGSGVHMGTLDAVQVNGGRLITRLRDSRRIHYWVEAASLSQMAIDGLPPHNDTRIAMEVPLMVVSDGIEIIPCSAGAYEKIKSYQVWKK